MNNFQTILVAIFMAFFVFAVLIFSGALKIGGGSSTSGAPSGKVVIWGTFNNTPDLIKVFQDLSSSNQNLMINYVQKPEAEYKQDLIQAFASDTGPDLFFMTPDMIDADGGFVYKIPYASYPQKNFTDSFVGGANVFLTPDGSLGFPMVVDPIVLYYNKNLFSNAGLATVPQYWDELINLSSTLTSKQNDGTIQQSAIALGRFDNVTNAKDILATLLLQSGNQIVQQDSKGIYTSVLDENVNSLPSSPIEQILNFYIRFSNPSDSAYTWNSALPNSVDMFTSGKLAMYIGHASELFEIESANPNLSFDVAPVLQTRGTNITRTYGTIYTLAVNKKSSSISAALGVAGLLSGGSNAGSFASATSLPPALRILLANKPASDPYLTTFFNSAITSMTWPDPDSTKSDAIFSELVQNILSNKLSLGDAIRKAQGEMQSIIK